ncbi:hypothetical protein TpMuguga_01g02300 [Theileria parva strain Muguga]|uniref:uncharacterized protein n=1 Tax=Theileria parva strain Muguga TaxID=333668 RepID=UPI001C617432|nr:uncharacterized protein TpMuguga_01g02300 [Theileria parva strain Muguga]KAF5153485.1 hypothetical protein TpMuguga_01g02300 [Theileria parva strain Muguga]
MSSNLRKLRFMQKSDEKPQTTTEKVVNTLIGDKSIWIREGFEEIHKFHDEKADHKQKYPKIRYMTRRSYNGANPSTEGFMQKLKKKTTTQTNKQNV